MAPFVPPPPRLAVLALGLAAGPACGQTPGFTISPAVITNDFCGQDVFTITGLSNGQQVTVQRWTDLNGDGVIGADDVMQQAFKVTDGKVPMIGGVRNINQPGDQDGATNGQITAKLNIPGASLLLDRFAGNYLYRLVDASGTPLATNSYTVLQQTQSQGVTGYATAADTGAPLTNALVVLVSPNGPAATASWRTPPASSR